VPYGSWHPIFHSVQVHLPIPIRIPIFGTYHTLIEFTAAHVRSIQHLFDNVKLATCHAPLRSDADSKTGALVLDSALVKNDKGKHAEGPSFEKSLVLFAQGFDAPS
jgi:hypothetical protein